MPEVQSDKSYIIEKAREVFDAEFMEYFPMAVGVMNDRAGANVIILKALRQLLDKVTRLQASVDYSGPDEDETR